MKLKLTRGWFLFLSFAFFAGIVLRLIFVQDMEYKEDEEYNFNQTQFIGHTQPWPWYGIPSGVYIVNPGMSIWVFTLLAKLFGIHSPTSLAHAVQLFALGGMALILPFALKWIHTEDERKTWLWALALALVNPFLVLYQRKLWPEPFLPFFTMLTFMGWWKRRDRSGAFLWGLFGAFVGQVHMSGFFLAAALFLWSIFFDKALAAPQTSRIQWKYWFLGSCMGALPLIPWFLYILQNPVNHAITSGWSEAAQLKYWVFWFTDPLGLHLGNPLGLLRGPSHWDQISDFVRYPLLNGQATYLVGLAHFGAVIAAVLIFGKAFVSIWKSRRQIKSLLIGTESQTAFIQSSALFGCGILMTLTGVMIRRYYMAVTFPLEFICLVRMADLRSRLGHILLITLWICELFISANFVGYIHVNQGSTSGDYGPAYHTLKKPQVLSTRPVHGE